MGEEFDRSLALAKVASVAARLWPAEAEERIAQPWRTVCVWQRMRTI